MAKTRDDEIYEKGVKEGQRGGIFDDFIEGNIPAGSREEKIYKDGYWYGQEHRYGPEGRYHTWDSRGSNDPKDKREERGERKRETKSDSSETKSDPYFYGRDNDRSYTDTGESFSYGASGFGYGVLFLICVVIFFAAGFDKVIENEVIKKIWPTYQTRAEKALKQKQEWEQWKYFSTSSDKWLKTSGTTPFIPGAIIVVSHHESGYSIIYSVNPNTSRANSITHFPRRITNLSLSSDGEKIAFIAGQENNEIYVMNSDGTNIRRVTKTTDGSAYREITWSSSPSFILATRQDHPYAKTIWMIERDRNQPHMIIPTYEEYANKWVPESKKQHFTFYSCESPSVSPDGKKLAFVRNEYSGSLSWAFQKRSQICLKELKSAFGPGHDKETYLKDFGAARVRLGPQAWSPDGNKIVFQISFGEKDSIGIWNLRNWSSLSEPEWLKVPGKNPSWSLDGKWIAFNDGKGAVYAYEITSENIVKIAGPKFNGKPGEIPLWISSVKSTNKEDGDGTNEIIALPKYSTTRTTILRSSDKGKTWNTFLSVDNIPTLAIALVDSVTVNDAQSISVKLRGWVNEVIETRDGGRTWELINYHGRCYGSKTASLRTQDGGRTWQKIDVRYR